MEMTPIAVVLAAVAVLGLVLTAQTLDHSAHGVAGADSPSTQGFIAANVRMHTDMAIEFTGNADVDFIRGMIPHHQGTVDMARVVLPMAPTPRCAPWPRA